MKTPKLNRIGQMMTGKMLQKGEVKGFIEHIRHFDTTDFDPDIATDSRPGKKTAKMLRLLIGKLEKTNYLTLSGLEDRIKSAAVQTMGYKPNIIGETNYYFSFSQRSYDFDIFSKLTDLDGRGTEHAGSYRIASKKNYNCGEYVRDSKFIDAKFMSDYGHHKELDNGKSPEELLKGAKGYVDLLILDKASDHLKKEYLDFLIEKLNSRSNKQIGV